MHTANNCNSEFVNMLKSRIKIATVLFHHCSCLPAFLFYCYVQIQIISLVDKGSHAGNNITGCVRNQIYCREVNYICRYGELIR